MNIEEAIGMLNGMAAHADWAEEWMPKYEITDSNIHSIVQKEIGLYLRKSWRMQEFIREQRKGKLHSKDLLKVYKKKYHFIFVKWS